MYTHNSKIISEGLTYDDVLLVPNFSDVLPREVSIQSKFSRNITLNVPVVSAAMDTVTESSMAIAMAQEGGIGVLHKNMTIEQQAAKVRKVKRAESGMIIDPVTLPLTAKVIDAKNAMKEFGIGGIPIVDDNQILKGIVTNRDLRFEKNNAASGVAIFPTTTSSFGNLAFTSFKTFTTLCVCPCAVSIIMASTPALNKAVALSMASGVTPIAAATRNRPKLSLLAIGF